MCLCEMCVFLGSRRRTPPRKAGVTRRAVLHGPNIHRYILFRDVDQVAGVGFPKLFHERLVLAGLHNRYGKTTRFDQFFDVTITIIILIIILL